MSKKGKDKTIEEITKSIEKHQKESEIVKEQWKKAIVSNDEEVRVTLENKWNTLKIIIETYQTRLMEMIPMECEHSVIDMNHLGKKPKCLEEDIYLVSEEMSPLSTMDSIDTSKYDEPPVPNLENTTDDSFDILDTFFSIGIHSKPPNQSSKKKKETSIPMKPKKVTKKRRTMEVSVTKETLASVDNYSVQTHRKIDKIHYDIVASYIRGDKPLFNLPPKSLDPILVNNTIFNILCINKGVANHFIMSSFGLLDTPTAMFSSLDHCDIYSPEKLNRMMLIPK